MGKIPQDFKRWLKDNGHYNEFLRLVNICGYRVDDLCHRQTIGNKVDYGLKRWFTLPISERSVSITGTIGNTIKYTDFLEKYGLNYK